MPIENDAHIKKAITRYAPFWLFGLTVSMILGAFMSVTSLDDLMLGMGYSILLLNIISGALKAAVGYFCDSALLCLCWFAWTSLTRAKTA